MNSDPKSFKTAVKETIRAIEEISCKRERAPAINTGFYGLDYGLDGGLWNGEVGIVHGRGKTSFLFSLAMKAAGNGFSTVCFCPKDGVKNLVFRAVSRISNIPVVNLRNSVIADNEWSKLSRACGILAEQENIFFDESMGLSTSQIESRVKNILPEKPKATLIIISSLDFILPPQIPLPLNSEPLTLADRITRVSAQIEKLKEIAERNKWVILVEADIPENEEETLQKKKLFEQGVFCRSIDLVFNIRRDRVKNEPASFSKSRVIIDVYRRIETDHFWSSEVTGFYYFQKSQMFLYRLTSAEKAAMRRELH